MPDFIRNSPVVLYATIGLLLAGIFVIDLNTPLGVAEWVLYLVPVSLSLFSQRPVFPLLVALAASALIFVGFYQSAAGQDPTVAATNRSLAAAALWLLAGVGYAFINSRQKLQRVAWLGAGQAQMAQQMLGELTPEALAGNLLRSVSEYLDAQVGVMYAVERNSLEHLASWALPEGQQVPKSVALASAGLTGQAAIERRVMIQRDLPASHLRVGSTLGSSVPAQVVAAPMSADGAVFGVLELGFTRSTSGLIDELEFLKAASEAMGMAMRSSIYRRKMQELLEETQRQGEELQAQQEELRVSNEELEEQGTALRESQARLEQQQAELEQTNTQLEDRSETLQKQKEMLQAAQRALNITAQNLERTNQYKSEFLANMSHELRTPLNSSLILSKLLADNRGGNLTDEQTRFAQTIYSSNTDLMTLINDILDLSKIEAGRVDLHPETLPLEQIINSLESLFRPVAQQKKLAFLIQRAPESPESLVTDEQHLLQVLKNLLSNAFKFTDTGEVVLRIAPAAGGYLRFEVRDTGIGIASANHDMIFEAFRQADGSTSRKYGGSGLGLSISRELARVLGGELSLASEPGHGSTFTLQVPLTYQPVAAAATPAPATSMPPLPVLRHTPLPEAAPAPAASGGPLPAAAVNAPDDRNLRTRGARLILVVEDDPNFSRILHDLAHEMDFDCVRTSSAVEAVTLARELQPCGVLLDIGLPDDSGLTVLERLKRNSRTRHIPVHMVSANDHSATALQMGAIGYSFKPAGREELIKTLRGIETRLQHQVRKVLVVEDDTTLRESLGVLLKANYTDVTGVGTVAEARAKLKETTYDCIVMDLALPDGSGHHLLEHMADSGVFPPVIVYTGRMLDAEEEHKLRRYSKSIIIKGAKSPERLLDEVTLFLHSVESELPADQQRMLAEVRSRDSAFDGRRILLAEDDVRNIFALSQIIEPLGAKLEIARNGREALDLLAKNAPPDLVLMDIMMPEMDGIAAMQEIRKNAAFAKLPIIALTARAMPEDRQRCLDAGASDYISKPIDVEKLLSLCRVWMSK